MTKEQEMCGTIREMIPDFVGGRLSASGRDGIGQHLDACDECRAELELVRALFESRPEAPPALVVRVLGSVGGVGAARRARAYPTGSWGRLAAAAVAALALGIGLSADRASEGPVEVPGYAYEVEEGDIWVSDDALLAGAPLFDDLSDDALLQLLDELSVGSPGGSA